jgi:endoglucanase
MKFIDLLLGVAAIASVLAAPATDATPTVKKRKSKFLWSGVNESGAEFGNTALPGQLGKDYTWPAHSTIDVGFLN